MVGRIFFFLDAPLKHPAGCEMKKCSEMKNTENELSKVSVIVNKLIQAAALHGLIYIRSS